ncbi:PhzF family phenazine biosynthesis protein [Ferrovum sp.]|uniref:PhzF family phenazine biosynthesis protein n=1 Tax=Ferrovum sp. TaxID=2609467 RepID=UPI002610A4F1|nr:PhzF family phenazine biosynthesis protein [Ferrovum sp.]
MNLEIFQVDAFASRPFEGNPAAVFPLEQWLDDELLQSIAAENNLSETAFFVPSKDGLELRWFTPTREVTLCGHATLATAHVMFEHLGYPGNLLVFDTLSGKLSVQKNAQGLEMDFPALPSRRRPCPDRLAEGLGCAPVEVWCAEDYLAVFEDEETVLALQPHFDLLAQLDLRGVIVTAPGRSVDFVSRFFAPKYGVPEDPVCGSAHCELAPYWAQRLGKTLLNARQISKRGGSIGCELKSARVLLTGQAVTVMSGILAV